MKDNLVIKCEKVQVGLNYRPVTITEPNYDAIKAISDETGHSLSKVACMLIEFALERVTVEK